MTNEQRFKLLQVFGDAKPHGWFEVIYLGVHYLRTHQSKFEKYFRLMLEYGLIYRIQTPKTLARYQEKDTVKTGIWIGPDWKDFDYLITPKGDECLRAEQIRRGGDVSYYKYFDRSVDGRWGVNHFKPLPGNMRKQSKPASEI